MFSGTPFTSRTKLEGTRFGHVRLLRSYGLLSGDGRRDLLEDTEHALDDMTTTKMYVTGGVGSRSDGEAFGDAYELPNFRAYGESCAAIGNMMWNWRMLPSPVTQSSPT